MHSGVKCDFGCYHGVGQLARGTWYVVAIQYAKTAFRWRPTRLANRFNSPPSILSDGTLSSRFRSHSFIKSYSVLLCFERYSCVVVFHLRDALVLTAKRFN